MAMMTFYGESYFCDPKGQFIGDLGSAFDEELIVRDLDLSTIQEVRDTWHFLLQSPSRSIRRAGAGYCIDKLVSCVLFAG